MLSEKIKLQKYKKSSLKITRNDESESLDMFRKRKYFKKGELFKKHPYIEALPGVFLLPYNNLDVHGEYEIVDYCYPGAKIDLQAIIALVIDGKQVPVDILYFTYEGKQMAMAFDVTEHMKWIENMSKIALKEEEKGE